MRILESYKDMNLESTILAKAENLRSKISEVIGEDTEYKLLGTKHLTITYKRGARSLHSVNEENRKSYMKAREELTQKEFGLFSNLNNLKNPDILDDYVNVFTIVPDEYDKTAKQILMMRQTTNSLGQIVLYKTAVILRKYTDEEKIELAQKEDNDRAIALGFGNSMLEDLAVADWK